MKYRFALLVLALATACSSAEKTTENSQNSAGAPSAKSAAMPETLDAAVNNNPYRTPENKARDVYRHPLETLRFFGIEPDMTVVEIWPGAGWYAEILAPYLNKQGKYIAVTPPPNPSATYMTKFTDWLDKHPEISSKTTKVVFNPPNEVEIAPPGSADMVLTFRNVHNWLARKTEKEMFASFFKALKPGGILGVVEHRADAKKKRDPEAKSGYVRESDVIRMAEQAGFKLAEKSEINSNPKDTKNYPKGVWTLPPTYAMGDKDRETYAAIGESDRMTLKFIKPAK